MKRILLFTTNLFLLMLIPCTTRSDRVLAASDELHSLFLFEKDNDFDMSYNGLNTVKGTYSLKGDTIFLNYSEGQFEEFDANKQMTKMLLIDTESNRVNGIGPKMQFCANIYLDKRIRK